MLDHRKLFSKAAKLKAEMPELAEFEVTDFIPLAVNLSLPLEKRLEHLRSVIGPSAIDKAVFRSDEIPLLRYYYKIWETKFGSNRGNE